MKATGIVRRIDDYVIIGARSENLENTGVSLILPNFCAPDNHGWEGLRWAATAQEGGGQQSQFSYRSIPAADALLSVAGLFYFPKFCGFDTSASGELESVQQVKLEPVAYQPADPFTPLAALCQPQYQV